MKTTFDLPDDIAEALKRQAYIEGVSSRQIVLHALRLRLGAGMVERSEANQGLVHNGDYYILPTRGVGHPPITDEMVTRIREEMDRGDDARQRALVRGEVA